MLQKESGPFLFAEWPVYRQIGQAVGHTAGLHRIIFDDDWQNDNYRNYSKATRESYAKECKRGQFEEASRS